MIKGKAVINGFLMDFKGFLKGFKGLLADFYMGFSWVLAEF